MCAEDRTAPIIVSERNIDKRSRKLLRFYPELVNYFLKKYVTDQAIVEYDVAIFRYMQPAHMTLQQYAEDLVAKSYKVADVCDEGTLEDVFIESGDASILHSIRN